MAAVVSQELIFSKDKIGDVFDISTDGIGFSLLTQKGRNYWHKDKPYWVFEEDYIKLTHTVVKIFDDENPQQKHIGYAVLVDVIEDGKSPQFLSYFPESPAGFYQYEDLKKSKDYIFYLGSKKYSLASDGTITESKKEERESVKELQKDVVETEGKKKKSFLKNRYFASPILPSFSSISRVSELTDKSQQSNDKSKKGRGFFKPKASSLLSSSASSPDIDSVSSSPEIDRTDSPKIENISSSSKVSRASSASPKIKSIHFGK